MWMPFLTVSIVTVYFGFYLLIVFLTLSVATGLYYLAELIEEFTATTRRLLGYAIKTELALHLLLLLDRLPLGCLGLGLVAHVCYARLLRRFPYLQLASLDALLSVAAFASSTAAWVWHYRKTNFTVEYTLAFLVVTTFLVPFVLVLSMAGDQAVLPGAGGYPYSSSPVASPGIGRTYSSSNGGAARGPPEKRRRGLALRIFDVLRRKRDEALPGVMSRLPSVKESIA